MKFKVYIQNQISWRSIWPVIRVQNSLPCDGAGVDVQECKLSGTMELKMIQIQNSCTGSQDTSLNRSAKNKNNQNSPDFICAECIRISLLDAKFDKPSDLTWFWFEFIIKVENKTMLDGTLCVHSLSPGSDWTFCFPSLLGQVGRRKPPVVESDVIVSKNWTKLFLIC